MSEIVALGDGKFGIYSDALKEFNKNLQKTMDITKEKMSSLDKILDTGFKKMGAEIQATLGITAKSSSELFDKIKKNEIDLEKVSKETTDEATQHYIDALKSRLDADEEYQEARKKLEENAKTAAQARFDLEYQLATTAKKREMLIEAQKNSEKLAHSKKVDAEMLKRTLKAQKDAEEATKNHIEAEAKFELDTAKQLIEEKRAKQLDAAQKSYAKNKAFIEENYTDEKTKKDKLLKLEQDYSEKIDEINNAADDSLDEKSREIENARFKAIKEVEDNIVEIEKTIEQTEKEAADALQSSIDLKVELPIKEQHKIASENLKAALEERNNLMAQKKLLEDRLKVLNKEQEILDAQEAALQDKLAQAEENGDEEAIASLKEALAGIKDKKEKNSKEIESIQGNKNDPNDKGGKLGDIADRLKENGKEAKAAAKEQNKAAWESLKSGESTKSALKQGLQNVVNAVMDMSKQIDQKISAFYAYQAKMEARLQGSQTSYASALKMISKNVGMSPFMSQEKIVQKMQELIESGIAYDVELRAFLGVISEDIASTFNVMQASLARMIRIQQSDSTAMRLGMEAYLTRFYNGLFSDTSYLTDQFDSVTDAIFEASSQLEKAQSIEFEYAVQKWLGSLYSLGLSQNAISQIANGLNYLGSGDVESLNGNSQLVTLFNMAMSKADGLSYADAITNGLDASKTNSLMLAMVEYLRDIAQQTKDNNVVAKSYSNMLGISMSDLTVLSKIDNKTLTNISNSMMSYGDTLKELNYQTSQIASRVHMSTMLDTLKNNALMSAATGIGSNPALYAMWLAASVVKDVTGGINIPAISVFGSGIDLETTVMDLILTGIGGFSLLTSLLGALFNGSLFGTYDLQKWGYDEATTRGNAPKIGGSGVSSGFSQSTQLSSTGSSSAEDIEDSTLASNAESGAEKGKKMNESAGVESEHTFDEFYDKFFDETIPSLEDTYLEAIKEATSETRDLLKGGLIIDKIKKLVTVGGTVSIAGMEAGADGGITITSGGGSSSSSGSVGDSSSYDSDDVSSGPIEVCGALLESIKASVVSIESKLGSNAAQSTMSNNSSQTMSSNSNSSQSSNNNSIQSTLSNTTTSYTNGGSRQSSSTNSTSQASNSYTNTSGVSEMSSALSSSNNVSATTSSISSNKSSTQSSSSSVRRATASNSNYAQSSISSNNSNVNASEQSLENIENVEATLNKYSSEGDATLNVNVKNIPSVIVEDVGKETKQYMSEYSEKILRTVLEQAIKSGLNVIDDEGEAVDIGALLNEIEDHTRRNAQDTNDIERKLNILVMRNNM